MPYSLQERRLRAERLAKARREHPERFRIGAQLGKTRSHDSMGRFVKAAP